MTNLLTNGMSTGHLNLCLLKYSVWLSDLPCMTQKRSILSVYMHVWN